MIRFIQKHIGQKRKALVALGVVGSLGLAALSGAQAATLFATEPCDPDYYESLKSRAWLEAQREITQNQNLIYKPDSVLEYTCFNRFLNELADHGGKPIGPKKMFTATNRWNNTAADLATTLTNVIGEPLHSYDKANFDHNLLGGRHTTKYDIPKTVSGDDYTCSVMKRIWRDSKCTNFAANASTDGFFTFSNYAHSPDKRYLPTPCTMKPSFGIQRQKALIDKGTPWIEDHVRTYYELIYPSNGSCGPTHSFGSSRIKTGLVVKRTAGGLSEYDEYACIVPGCYYNPNTKKCVR